MTRLFLIALLVLSSGPAYAEWVDIGITTHDGATVYFDPDTIRRNGDRVKMWELDDFKTIQTVASYSYLSSKVQREFDCTEERMRVLEGTTFSGNMGNGQVVYAHSDENKWQSVELERSGKALWIVACNKK